MKPPSDAPLRDRCAPRPAAPWRRWLLTLVVAALAALHAALLFERVADATLLRPEVAVRWLAAVALLFGVGLLRRRGLSLTRGRGAAVFWLLALLIHVQVPAGAEAATAPVGALDPLALLPVVLGFALAAGLGLSARRAGTARAAELARGMPAPGSRRPPLHPAFFPSLFERPPPIRG